MKSSSTFNSKFAENALPGYEIVEPGLNDLENNIESVNALLLLCAGSRLRQLGIAVPYSDISDPSIRLYLKLSTLYGDGAHSKYNALRRRLLSFISSLQSSSA